MTKASFEARACLVYAPVPIQKSENLGLPAAFTMRVALAAFNGNAEPSAGPPGKHAPLFSPADRAAFLDARIAALHAGLELSSGQEKLWPAVETALRTASKNATDRFQKVKDEPEPASLVDRLRRRGENAGARGQSLEAVADAAAPLYGSLTEDQKHRLPVLMHGLGPHRHFAMMGDGHEHWGWRRGGRNEPEGHAPEDGDRSIPKDR